MDPRIREDDGARGWRWEGVRGSERSRRSPHSPAVYCAASGVGVGVGADGVTTSIVFSITLPVTLAIFDPIPARVQMTVKVLLWTYIILCAAMIFAWTNEPVLAGATVALLVPAVLLGKWIYVT